MTHYPPIAVFAYNRQDEIESSLLSLNANFNAEKFCIFIFCDGPKNSEDEKAVSATRRKIASLKNKLNFSKIILTERSNNLGLAQSIILGVSEVLKKYDSIIVIEDDLYLNKNFLNFMKDALEFYKYEEKIISVSGYAPRTDSNMDINFSVRASSHGWATWRDRWKEVDWNVPELSVDLNSRSFLKLLAVGGEDLKRMLLNYSKGKLDSWAIRFVYHQVKFHMLSVVPKNSLVEIGGNKLHATNTYNEKYLYKTKLETNEKISHRFKRFEEYDLNYLRQFRKNHSNLSRIKHKILKFLNV